jgi:hypothetical protein
MAHAVTRSLKQESIIEVSNKKGPGECYHSFDNYTQVFSVAVSEDKWIRKQDTLKIEAIYYDSKLYSLLFLPKDNKLEYETKVISNGTIYIHVKRKTLLPRKIKAGTVLGEAILIPKVESHFLILHKEM